MLDNRQEDKEKTARYSPSYEEFSTTKEQIAKLEGRYESLADKFATKRDVEEVRSDLKAEIPNMKVWVLTGILGIIAILGSWLITVIINVVVKILT